MTNNKISSLQDKLDKLQKEYKELEEKQLEKIRKGETIREKGDPKILSLNEGGGPLFFITAYGMKRLYRKPENDPSFNLSHKTCKPFLKNGAIQNVGVTSQEDVPGELGVPISLGEPCGYENHSVGVKNETGGYDKIGYVSKKGKLHPFASKNLDKVGRTCPTKIVEITNDEWDTFTKSEVGIKDGQECRLFDGSDYDKLLKIEIEIEEVQEELKNAINTDVKIHDDAEECLGGKMNKMKKLNKQVNAVRKDMDTTNAMKEQYDLYQIFYKNRIWLFLILIAALIIGLVIFMKRSGGIAGLSNSSSTPAVAAPVAPVQPVTSVNSGIL